MNLARREPGHPIPGRRDIEERYHCFDEVVDLARYFARGLLGTARARQVRLVLRLPDAGGRFEVRLAADGRTAAGPARRRRLPLRYRDLPRGLVEWSSADEAWSPADEHAVRQLVQTLVHHLERHRLRRLARRRFHRDLALVGTSPAMEVVDRFVERASASPLPALVIAPCASLGLAVATALHLAGPRAGGPLIVAEGLADAASPAPRLRTLRRQAAGGTLLLAGVDAWGETARPCLVELLDRCVEGGGAAFRLVSTAAPGCADAVRGGVPDDPLLERLGALRLRVAPLRTRGEDVEPLLEHFLAAHVGAARPELTPRAVAACRAYDWPGDADQLQEVCVRLARRCGGGTVRLADLRAVAPEVLDPVPALSHRLPAGVHHPALRRAVRFVSEHYQQRLSLDQAARFAYVSPSHLAHLFKRETGGSFLRLLTELRVVHAERLLVERPRLSVTAVAADAGFGDLRHFQRVFKASRGCTASDFRRRAGGGVPAGFVEQDSSHPPHVSPRQILR